MRITDLLEELIDSSKKEKTYKGTLSLDRFKPRKTSSDTIAHGSHATVKADKNDPHMVVKHNTRAYKANPTEKDLHFGNYNNDGFNEFIEYIINNNLTDNIHFPKVYNITTITDKDGSRVHKYTMERLVNDLDVDEKLRDASIESLVTEEYFKSLEWHDNPFIAFCKSMEHYVRGNRDLDFITSESLIEALKIVRQAALKIGKNRLDMHAGNFMWRRTSFGLILVITDPLF